MSMAGIREAYGVPAKRGMRVEYTGGKKPVQGVIVASSGSMLRVRLDGAKGAGSYHPTWQIRYLTPDAAP